MIRECIPPLTRAGISQADAEALRRIEPDGTVHAGCHTVPWSEIEACALTLGLLEPCPA